MRSRLLLIPVLIFVFTSRSFSQDYFSYGGGNYSGLNQIFSNPAAIADNKLKLDLILLGYDLHINNSWFGIEREALKYSGSVLRPSSISWPSSWKNLTPNVPNNVFKNFNFINSGKEAALLFESRFIYPSMMFQIDKNNSVAFTRSVRQIANVDGISEQLATLFEKELDLNVTQNNRVQNESLNMIEMTWAEYGFTYARVLWNKDRHFLKGGVTAKLLYGIESAYLQIKDLDFLLSTKDTLSYLNANISYAHSGKYNGPLNVKPRVDEYNRFVTGASLGLDLGFVYEWRPGSQAKDSKVRGKGLFGKRETTAYKLKLGAAIVDLGKIKYKKEGTRYDLDLAVTDDDISTFTTMKNFAMLDSLLRADYANNEQADHFSVLLPTAVNLQIDYAIRSGLFLNLSAHLTDFFKSSSYRVHNYSAICLAPRIEHFWFDIALPFTYNTLSARRGEYVMLGLNIRMGPLSIGTNNIIQPFSGDMRSMNYYFILRFAIPYKNFEKGK